VEVQPLSPALGARVVGVDPADPDSVGRHAPALRAAMAEHLLLVLSVPDLAPADQRRLAALFGPVADESADGSGWTLVSNVEEGGRLGDGAYLFHSDLEFTEAPLRYLSLYALEVPRTPTHTRFANGIRAAAHLDATTRADLAGRTAVHVFPLVDARGDRRFRLADLDPGAPRAVHPLLLEHPETHATILYATAMQTDSVVGLPEAQSEALLARAWEAAYAPDNVFAHEWSTGDLLLWDNLALQHARDEVSGRRTLRRVPVGTRVAHLRTGV